MARRSRKQGLAAELIAAPWQVSAVLAGVAFIVMKAVLPAVLGGNPVFAIVVIMLSQLAWLVAGSLLLLALLSWLRSRQQDGGSAGKLAPLKPVQAEPSHYDTRVSDLMTSPATQSEPAPVDGLAANWSLELIRALEWKRFEDVCQKFYELKGIRAETTPLGPDGGIDIRLFQDDSGRATSIVQCKAWGERFVGVKPVRELLGVMTHEKIAKAFFMTCGQYSDDAKAVASSNNITLMDGEMLLMMFLRLPQPARDELLRFATAGDYHIPTCPGCGGRMRAVSGKAGRASFWGCQHYPRCKHTLGMRQV
ncbi:restriction endonuclease [Vogesella sp. LIG4]|uniref:restriction endonuclease n=1 Tax=Vogesella sp. LIG4 TaxID=1192162 RepID=UPI00081F9DCA|nr:restriction endonuclease [Vogesella sp. LIG4]SCK22614.1 restriction system protein [Vogesella sp. LIG4]